MGIETIISLINLRKELPEAVGYEITWDYMMIPEEITNSLILEKSYFFYVRLTISNYTNKLKKDVRILYNGEMLYDPMVFFHKRKIKVDYSISDTLKEIHVASIPPNDSVIITLYPGEDYLKIVEQILIGEDKITNRMNKMMLFSKNPYFLKAYLVMFLLSIFLLFIVGFSTYLLWDRYQYNQKIETIYSQHRTCINHFYKYTDKDLERKFKQMDEVTRRYNLMLNKVENLENLLLKDEILLCIPEIK